VALDMSAWSTSGELSHHGPSGSGKSTLMISWAALHPPPENMSGCEDVSNLDKYQLPPSAIPNLAISPVIQPVARTTALRNVTLPWFMTAATSTAEQWDQVAKEMLEQVGLGDA